MTSTRLVLGLIITLLGTGTLLAQEEAELGLEELLNKEITVASQKAMTLRESPGIVTIITKEELNNSGARDLIDVLLLVPGFFFGVDVEGVVSLGMRGNWAQEGKVLLLIDGNEFNEPLYSCLMFGNHFSVDQIKKIEIIRGPGSAIYGGYAELGVINIITKEPDDINGVSSIGTYGQMEKTYARRNLNLLFGKEFGNLGISAAGFIGEGNRSDQNYTDFYGDTYNMKDNSKLNPFNLNFGLGYKGLEARFIIDRYQTTERDYWGENLSAAVGDNFNSYFLGIKYNGNLGSNLTVVPKINYKQQTPWQLTEVDPDSLTGYFNVLAKRLTGNLTISYNPKHEINIIGGGEYLIDTAEVSAETPPEDYFSGDKKGISYNNASLFGQLMFNLPFANFTLGGRYDKHSQYGASFVPRVGITKVIKDIHFKILYSNAFRAPSIKNIDLEPEIKPERTQVLECETGYKLSDKMFVAVNAFDIIIKEPIVYYTYFDTVSGEWFEGYRNYGKVNTRGLETEFRYKNDWGYATVNHSYYLVNENTVDLFEIPDNKLGLLGAPGHKISLNSHIKIIKNLSLNPSAIYLSPRYGYYTTDTLDNPVCKRYESVILFNIFSQYNDLLVRNLNLGIGVYDILNEKFEFVQPYNNWHAPLPGPSREIVLKLSYNYKF